MATLLDRIMLGLRAVVNDAVDDVTFADARAPAKETTPRDVERLLKRAEKRLKQVERDQADALAREKRTAAALSEANARMDALDREVDAALRANQQDLARTKLDQLRHLRVETAELEKQLRIHASVEARLQQEAEDLRRQLATIRAQLKGLTELPAGPEADTATAAATPRVDQQAQTAAKAQSASPARQESPPADAQPPRTDTGDEGFDTTRIADALARMKKNSSDGK